MKCLVCGHIIKNNSGTCPVCGAQIGDDEEDSLYQSFSEYDSIDYIVTLARMSTGEVKEAKELPCVVGRSSKCDIVIKGNPAIGRKHAEINRVGDRIFVKDLGSRNHTYINDERITSICVIDERARMRLADEEFVIEVKERDRSD